MNNSNSESAFDNVDTISLESDDNTTVYSVQDDSVEDGEVKDMSSDNFKSGVQLPIFEIIFHQGSDYTKLGDKIVKALQAALSEELTQTVTFSIKRSDDASKSVRIDAYLNDTPVTFANPDADMIDEKPADDFFIIDTAPSTKLDTIKVPSYKRTIKEVLKEESLVKKKKSSEDECQRPRPSASCFNCGSNDHGLRDCPKTRNVKRINRSKKAFLSKQDRYHVDIEQRFAHLRPGAISEQLKSALGLRNGEIPFFFYRMRTLGYPPGWLEDAKVSNSGINLFSADGTKVLKSDDEGDINTLSHKYDASKIIEFPGFNADPGEGFFDDYKYHKVPPINAQDKKSEFIKSLGDNVTKGYRRKKFKYHPIPNATESEQSESTIEVTDMDIEDPEIDAGKDVVFTRPLPPTNPPKDAIVPPPPSSLESPKPSLVNADRAKSPTLADLEAEQEKLLMELEGNLSNVTEQDDSLTNEVVLTEETHNDCNIQKVDRPATPKTPTGPPTSMIMESHMGTPLLKFSPFEKLPAGDNFKVGVSDVINFENLPDSTGKYENMKVVLDRMRIAKREYDYENE